MRRETVSTVLCYLALGVLAAACASTAYAQIDEINSDEAVKADVRFLASPELNGRSPMSRGSIRARRYIARQFKEAGLVPWGDATGYFQSIPFGKNVIGVLPGTDPALANEIVLVSAHYDHVGDGKLGATDNASGVGILLDLVREFSQSPRANKRTVCFAAFDCEEFMAWGAVSFTRRADFDPKRIAAVVNIDMVGRKAFDCMESTLFMGRTHTSPPIQAATTQAARDVGMQVLPYSTLLVGPRGDHVAFTSLGIPALFFSTGPFSDYHTRRDTVDKLDWNLVNQSRNVIAASVRELASGTCLATGPAEVAGSKDDLRAIRAVLTAHLDHPDVSAVDLRSVMERIDKALATEPFTATQGRQLLSPALLALGPQMNVVFGWQPSATDPEDAEPALDLMLLQLLFFEMHEADIMAHYRSCAAALFDRQQPAQDEEPMADILGTSIFPVCDDEIAIADLGGGQYHLGVVLPEITYRNTHKGWGVSRLLALAYTHFHLSWKVYTCRGSKDDLIDFCLLQSMDFPSDAHRKAWKHVLERVAPSRPKFNTIEEAIAYRISEIGCADMNELEQRAWARRNPDILREIFLSSIPYVHEAQVAARSPLLLDASVPVDIRARILTWHYIVDGSKESLVFTPQILAELQALTSDTTPIAPHLYATLDLSESIGMAPMLDKVYRQNMHDAPDFTDRARAKLPKLPPRTIGEAARIRLDEVARAAGKSACTPADGPILINAPCTFSQFPQGDVHWTEIKKNRLRLTNTGRAPETSRLFSIFW